MLRRLLALLLLAAAAPAVADVTCSTVAQSCSTGGTEIAGYTVAGLAALSPATNDLAIVTDGNAAGDCTTGGGSTRVLCSYTGSAWAAIGDGNSGAAPTFADIGTGSNTTATMVCGTGCSITRGGSGAIDATTADGLTANGGNCGAGEWAAGVDAAGASEGCTADDDVPDAGEVDDTALAAGAVDGGTGGEIADDSITAADVDETGAFAFATLTGKQGRTGVAVNDDDCTGEQGSWWWDSTDSAFEWCNANTGAPAVLGGGSSITGTDTHVMFFDGANTPAGEAGFTYNKTTDTATLAGDLVASGGDLTLGAAGTASTIASLYTGTAGLAFTSATAASGGTDIGFNFTVTGNLTTSDRVLCFGDAGSTTCGLGYMDGGANLVLTNGDLTASSVIAAASGSIGVTGRSEMVSPANGEMGFENAANSANAGIRFSRVVEVVTTTKSPSAQENGEIYTNTGDADGATVTLLNDPTIGSQICVAVDPAQTFTVAPGTGEKILQAGTEYATSCTNNVRGSTACLVAITGGSGALWSFLSAVGTWTCS